MRRDLVHDLGEAARTAQAAAAAPPAATTAWVRDTAWTHRPSDDFQGCTE